MNNHMAVKPLEDRIKELEEVLSRILDRSVSNKPYDHYSETFGPDFQHARDILSKEK